MKLQGVGVFAFNLIHFTEIGFLFFLSGRKTNVTDVAVSLLVGLFVVCLFVSFFLPFLNG